ncbi:DUF1835 domain-containing protein [Aestuariibaculum suncheonense]|uniref:DUF1835 domain-containing protein n=1 Tax=Aestuariibaculum suncheonense TaxID=1028745 RepID=A0A8J6Q5T8_9FLAO|nr:DUF1835 domain-containing protein [Aestuariibaculum suncheonense]MBD0835448.1 DUF1835 domain-containing protein [Aestuariibaculum suncheonense]
MSATSLHITNGTVLTNRLNELNIEGQKLTWQEMLCEGPTIEQVYSEAFYELRKEFFDEFYHIDLETDKIKSALDILNHTKDFTEIILWFEYDLFCHINMVAVISLIQQKKIKLPLYLVCSGRVRRSKNMKGLSELTTGQLLKHYNDKIKLNHDDIDLARNIWSIYCGKDHNLLKPYILKNSSFEYLSSCLKAHLERFPATKDGLNNLERNILQIVRDVNVNSINHLLGYALHFQGFYGYSDLQLMRIIQNLKVYIDESEDGLILNRKGHEVLLGTHRYLSELDNRMVFGGVKKCDFQFNSTINRLIKNV